MEIIVDKHLKGFNPQKIINSYGLGYDGKARLFFSTNCFRRMHKFVPFDTGALASTTEIRPNSVTYTQPYARKQYHENKGNGLRGKEWDKKMFTAEKDNLIREQENYMKRLKG